MPTPPAPARWRSRRWCRRARRGDAASAWSSVSDSLRRARAPSAAAAALGLRRLALCACIDHCCSRPSAPLVTQYSTRPAGKKAIITPNDQRHELHHLLLHRIHAGRRRQLLRDPHHRDVDASAGRSTDRARSGCRSTRSTARGAARPTPSSTQYSARKIGICTSIGRQPPIGLIFSFLYSSIIAICSFWLVVAVAFLQLLRCAAAACASWPSTCTAPRTADTAASLISITRPMIAQPQLPTTEWIAREHARTASRRACAMIEKLLKSTARVQARHVLRFDRA